MNFKKLVELFRESVVEDNIVFSIDNFLFSYRDGNSFSASHFANSNNLSPQTGRFLLNKLISMGLIRYDNYYECNECGSTIISSINSMATCDSCGTNIDFSDLHNQFYTLQDEFIHTEIERDLNKKNNYLKSRLMFFQDKIDSGNYLYLVLIDLRGSTILQKTENSVANEIIRIFNSEILPKCLAPYSDEGQFIKNNGDGFMYVFSSVSKAFYFCEDLLSLIAELPESNLIKTNSIKVKSYIHKLMDKPKIYLDLNDNIDILGYHVSKAHRFEHNAELPDIFKTGVLFISTDALQAPDSELKNFSPDTISPILCEWTESSGAEEKIEYYRMVF